MEERSLKIYSDKKIFKRITNTITKLLTPTKIGINGMIISIKRNNVIKAYENYCESLNNEEETHKDEIEKKYEKGNYKSGCLYCYIFNIGICDQHRDESWKQ